MVKKNLEDTGLNSRQISELNAYEVIREEQLTDLGSKGTLLRHKKSGARVALIGSTAMAVLIALLADTFIVIFAGSDHEMRRIGVICMVSQCIALPIHAWVAVVNMFCAGLGNAKGALALSTARQGTCFIPILYPMAWLLGSYGVATVQAVADVLSLALAIPIIIGMKKKIDAAQRSLEAQPVG